MDMGAFAKNVLRTIWGNRRRFLLLVLITMFGTEFFLGIRSASADMNATIDDYFGRQSMYDIKILSNYGLTNSHIEQFRAVSGVERVEPAYSADLFAKLGDASYLFRFHSAAPPGQESDMAAMPMVVLGRMPEQTGECAVSSRFGEMYACVVGDTLTLSTGDDTPLNSYVSHETYTITGFVDSPLHIRVNLGSSNKGSGSLEAFAYIPFDDFTINAYTEAQVFLSNPEAYSRFDDRFMDMSAIVEEALQRLGDEIASRRRQLLADIASREISKAAARIEMVRDALGQNESELIASEISFTDSEQDLLLQRTALNERLISGRRELEIGAIELATARLAIEQGRLALADGRRSLEEMLYNQDAVREFTESPDEIERQISLAEAELKAKEEKLIFSESETEDKQAELFYKADTLEAALYGGLIKLSAAEAELSSARDSLEDGRARFNAEKASADAIIASSEFMLSVARQNLRTMPEAKCYVLGLDQNLGFESFRQDSKRIENLSQVFPLFFFLVAALVTFTSMVRIVEDDRPTIAAIRALGYSPGKVFRKYISYALSVGIPGTAIGIIVGYRLFPTIVFDFGYSIMYLVPPVKTLLYPKLCVMVCAISLTSVVIPTILVSAADMRQSPAALMRPKAPLPGKRIFLERIDFVWARMNFSAKVTARNILRYKKRFVMTLAGISGCAALVLTGFGLRDSISTIASKQFDDIYLYDFIITVAEGRADRISLERYLTAQDEVTGWQYQYRENIKAKRGILEDAHTATLVIPDDADMLAEFVNLKEIRTGKQILPSGGGVVITQKLASLLGVSAGGEFTLIDDNDEEWTVVVDGVTEHYVGHFVYMPPLNYSVLTGGAPEYNTIVGKTTSLDDGRMDEMSEAILENNCVVTLSFNSKVRDFYSDLLNALNVVVFVLIICGALLAFVVLFSLTGINIDERKREIATLKVLGFHDKETSSYIFRENMINTVLGLILGLGLGIVLHQYIIRTVEIDMMIFGKVIGPMSFLYTAGLTFLFSFVVAAAMSGNIRNIDMIESLKSVE